MQINDIKELHYITPRQNVPSILKEGILSHNRAHGKNLVVSDFSLQTAQQIRQQKKVTIGERKGVIHDYANLYFQSLNPALYLKKDYPDLCILRVRPEILKRKGALVVDMNATAKEAQFYNAAQGLQKLSREVLFSDSWTVKGATKEEQALRKKQRCAEVLIPDKINPSYIAGAFVPTENAKTQFMQACDPPFPVDVAPSRFFQRSQTVEKVSDLFNSKFATVQNTLSPPSSPKKALPKGQRTITSFLKTAAAPSAFGEKLKIMRGSIFNSSCRTLVNTVNCKGVMGKGIALRFKEEHPEMFRDYKTRCSEGKVQLGKPYHYNDGVSIINFPTKDHWENKSDIDAIKEGLKVVLEKAQEWNLESVAFPPLGCGNGRLLWKDVGPIMAKALANAPFKVEIYVPDNTPDSQMTAQFLL